MQSRLLMLMPAPACSMRDENLTLPPWLELGSLAVPSLSSSKGMERCVGLTPLDPAAVRGKRLALSLLCPGQLDIAAKFR